MPRSPSRRWSPRRVMAVAFGASGVAHLVVPRYYEAIVPRWLPARRGLVLASGVAELVAAGGLLTEADWAGPFASGLLVAVWPANVQMALDAGTAGRPVPWRAALWLRVPLQLPMLRAVLTRTVTSGPTGSRP